MSRTITIRPAVEADLDWIVNELRSFSDFFETKIPLFPTYKDAYDGMKKHIDHHVLIVAELSGKLIGFISGALTTHVFNASIRVLHETFWWIPEQYRGGRAALLLLNEFTRIGKEKADWIFFTLEHKSPVNDRCLLSRGYKTKEHIYMLEVQ